MSVAASITRFRSAVPLFVLLSTVPQFYSMWFAWRLLTCLLPAWVYQRGDDALFSVYQRLILFFFDTCIGTKVHLHGDAEEVLKRKERVLYISNHQSTVDWVVVDMLAVRQGSLGNLRYIMKDGLQFLPVYGFYFYQHGCIYVRRGNFKPEKLIRGLDYLENPSIDTWLVIFPEGTRYNPSVPEAIVKSQQYAKDLGYPILENLLSPRSKGLYLALKRLRKNFDALYDVTILYDNTKGVNGERLRAPQLFEFIRLNQPCLHVHVNRIPISSVPEDEKELQTWLHQMFFHKDKMISKFYEKDMADNHPVLSLGRGTPSMLGLHHTLPALLLVAVFHIPVLACQLGRNLYWKIWLISTVGGYIWLAIRSVA